MSNLLWKSFNLCLSKFKCLPTITFSPPPTDTDTDQDHKSTAASAAAANPLPLFKNFNSLYDVNYSDDISTSKSLASSTTAAAATEDFFSSSEDSDTDSVPDFTSAFASHRFFFSSPGSSNSIFEPLEVEPLPPQDAGTLVSGGVAVQTYSPDPYSDFRKSMLEMIEARDLTDVNADWEFLHELLLCYLTLNPKHTHKFIVGAFADIIVSLLTAAPPSDACRKTHIKRHCATPRLSV
ncbi:UNVERIFIED_CONTAM: Transcription repressor OFP11 [Sesamum radiatum]|uniref:Transcription repressor n=1 Tax=Sesamum radiatum TaxID=300843 RepID=A0AAW2S8Y8_SESRA